MKVALLIIDMQETFLDEVSPHFLRKGREVISNVQKLLNIFRERNLPIIFVKRVHRGTIDIDKPRIPIADNFAKIGTSGADIVEELAPKEDEIVVIKKRFSAFFYTELELILRRLGIDTLILTGVQTPNCIRATAVDGLSYDYDVYVVSDGTASSTAEIQTANLNDLENMGAKIVNTEKIIDIVKRNV